MKRRLTMFAAVLCLLLGTAGVGVYVRSFWALDLLIWNRHRQEGVEVEETQWSLAITPDHGLVVGKLSNRATLESAQDAQAVFSAMKPLAGVYWTADELPEQMNPALRWQPLAPATSPSSLGRMGFRATFTELKSPIRSLPTATRSVPTKSVVARIGSISIPWWFMACFGLIPAPWLFRSLFRRVRSRRRTKRGLCAGCGYDLRASPERCPECGRAVESSPAMESSS